MAQKKEEKLKRILWLDTETTGLDHARLRVLEVGWTVTDLDLNRDPVLVSFAETGGVRSLVLADACLPSSMDSFVYDMHTKNGLIEQCRSVLFHVGNAERAILSSMSVIESHYDVPIEWTLGGAGVSTFDMRVLQTWFPELHAKLTYWTYDVSVVRRYMRDIFGIEETEQFKSDTHRVQEDVKLALAEARHFKNLMTELRQGVFPWTDPILVVPE